MARRYSRSASKDVKGAMGKRKRGTLRSGRSGRKVRSRKQAIAIRLSEARRKGKKVPPRKSARRRCERRVDAPLGSRPGTSSRSSSGAVAQSESRIALSLTRQDGILVRDG